MAQIVWSNKSLNDLRKIYLFIAENSVFYAERTIEKMRQRTQILKEHIEIGKKVPEFDDIKLRELIEGNYRIVYYITNQELAEIVAVVHSARDLTKLKLVK